MQGARDYAAANGLELDEAFTDEGVSAFRGQNFTGGALAAFLAACESGQVSSGSFLLVENLDRLSRQRPIEAVGQLQAILKHGITIVTLFDGRVFPPNALEDFGQLMMTVLTAQRAYEESATKSERLSRAWAAKREKALTERQPLTQVCPAWLELVDGRFVERPDRVEIVQRIFQMTIDGLGKAQIAGALNREGVPTFGRGKGWHPSTIQKIVSSDAAIGRYQPHSTVKNGDGSRKRRPVGDPIDGYFPSVIDVATFEKAKAVRGERRIPPGPRGARISNLFTGLAKCGLCGGPMHFDNKGGGYKRLTCGDRKRGVVGHRVNSWPYLLAERFAVLALHKVVDLAGMYPPAAERRRRQDIAQLENREIEVEQELVDLSGRMDVLVEAVETGGDIGTLVAQLRKRESERSAAQARLGALQGQLVKAKARLASAASDRQDTEEALRRWASVSFGGDDEAAFKARLHLQGLLKRTVERIEFELDEHSGAAFSGTIRVLMADGAQIYAQVDDANEDAEMRALLNHFAAPDGGTPGDWEESRYIEVPEWWPRSNNSEQKI